MNSVKFQEWMSDVPFAFLVTFGTRFFSGQMDQIESLKPFSLFVGMCLLVLILIFYIVDIIIPEIENVLNNRDNKLAKAISSISILSLFTFLYVNQGWILSSYHIIFHSIAAYLFSIFFYNVL